MTDKMPAEIWVTYGAYADDWWQETPDDRLDRYIHEFHYTRLLEAYRNNRELLERAEHSSKCPVSTQTMPPFDDCNCWKSEIEEVEGV